MNNENQFNANIDMNIKLKLNNVKYLNMSKINSYQAFMNIIMGGRGVGKTTQCIIQELNNNKKYGNEFIYLRRYKTETALQKELLNDFVDNVKFIGDKNNGGIWKIKNHTIGYLMALSCQSKYKSVRFPKVKTIIYDEGILLPGATSRYLQDEITYLYELMSTVFRNRKNVRVYILGNNLDFFNPYMSHFKVKPFKNIYFDKDRSLFIQYYKNSQELVQEEQETPLYKLTIGTAYHDYHYSNEVLLDNKVELSQIKNSDKLWFILKVNTYYINVYIRSNNKLIIQDSEKDISNDTGVHLFIMLSSQEVNYWDMKCFKNSKYYDALQYKYYKNEIDYTSQESSALLDMIIDVI